MLVSFIVTPTGAACLVERADQEDGPGAEDVERAARAFIETLFKTVTVPININ